MWERKYEHRLLSDKADTACLDMSHDVVCYEKGVIMSHHQQIIVLSSGWSVNGSDHLHSDLELGIQYIKVYNSHYLNDITPRHM